MFTSPGKIAFRIFDYPVMNYGIAIGLAISSALVILFKLRKKFCPDLSENVLADLAFYSIISGIIGARLWFVVLSLDYYLKKPFEIIMIHHGGLSIHGALFGGIITLFFLCKKHKLFFLKIADLFSVSLPIAQAIGRWGNFFNSEAFGKPTDLPWKLFIPIIDRPLEYKGFDFFHPAFLYECIGDIIIFLLLLVIYKNNKNIQGITAFSYLIMYSVLRITIENIRIDSVLNIGNVPVASVCSAFIIIVSTIALLLIYKNK